MQVIVRVLDLALRLYLHFGPCNELPSMREAMALLKQIQDILDSPSMNSSLAKIGKAAQELGSKMSSLHAQEQLQLLDAVSQAQHALVYATVASKRTRKYVHVGKADADRVRTYACTCTDICS